MRIQFLIKFLRTYRGFLPRLLVIVGVAAILTLMVHFLLNGINNVAKHIKYYDYELKKHCEILRKGTAENIAEDEYVPNISIQITDKVFNETMTCEFLKKRNYFNKTLPEEVAFPLAYSLKIQNNFEKFEQVFRLIWRPQNVYCVHLQSNDVEDYFEELIVKFAKCFDNVILPPVRYTFAPHIWQHVEIELQCLQSNLEANSKWQYYINLNKDDFPLMTNLEMVRVLKAMNGSALTDGSASAINLDRAPPKNNAYKVQWIKGSPNMMIPRKFGEFIMNNDNKGAQFVINELKRHSNDKFPMEMVFNTLAMNPHLGVPGAYKGAPETTFMDSKLPHELQKPKPHMNIHRMENWYGVRYPCKSNVHDHAVCVWGLEDMPYLLSESRPELFLHPIYDGKTPADFQDCIESRLRRRTALQMNLLNEVEAQDVKSEGGQGPPLSYYESLDLVWNHN